METFLEELKKAANSHHDGTVARVFSELAKVLETAKEKLEETLDFNGATGEDN